MLTVDSPEFRELIDRSTQLRNVGRYNDAVGLVKDRLHEMAPDCLKQACHHVIRTAHEGGLNELARQYTEELAKIEPDDPVVKEFRHLYGKASAAGA